MNKSDRRRPTYQAYYTHTKMKSQFKDRESSLLLFMISSYAKCKASEHSSMLPNSTPKLHCSPGEKDVRSCSNNTSLHHCKDISWVARRRYKPHQCYNVMNYLTIFQAATETLISLLSCAADCTGSGTLIFTFLRRMHPVTRHQRRRGANKYLITASRSMKFDSRS